MLTIRLTTLYNEVLSHKDIMHLAAEIGILILCLYMSSASSQENCTAGERHTISQLFHRSHSGKFLSREGALLKKSSSKFVFYICG